MIRGGSIYAYAFKTDNKQNIVDIQSLPSQTYIGKDALNDQDLLLGEFNGDGATDFLLSPKNDGSGDLWSQFISKGNGQWEQNVVRIANRHSDEIFFSQDIDKDGISDIVKFGSGYASLSFYYLGDGKCTGNESHPISTYATLIPTSISSHNYYTNLIVLNNVGKASQISAGVDKMKNRLLTGIIGSYGTINKISYKKLNSKETQFYSRNEICHFPYQRFNGGLFAVERLQTYNGGRLFGDVQYSYADAIFHKQGLGFRGFKEITAFNSVTGERVVQQFDPYNFGVMTNSEDSKFKKINVYKTEVSANKLARNLLMESKSIDKSKNIANKTTYEYDEYDNPVVETTDYGQGIKRIVSRQYLNVDSIDYVLGLPMVDKVTDVRDGKTSSVKVVIKYNKKCQPSEKTTFYNDNQTSISQFIYDEVQNLIKSSAKTYQATAWETKTYTYDEYGRMLRKVEPISTIYEDYTYNSTTGLLASTENQHGHASRYTYDEWGNKTATYFADGTVERNTTSWDATDNGGIYKCTSFYPNAPTKEVYYNSFGKIVKSGTQRVDGKFLYVSTLFDVKGRVEKVSLPYKTSPKMWTNYSYDNFDRPINITTGERTDTYIYDGLNVTSQINGINITKKYDPFGYVLSVDDAGGTTTYTYRADGQVDEILPPSYMSISFKYDKYGRKIEKVDNVNGATKYTYDDAGNVAREDYADGKFVVTGHDDYKRPTFMIASDLLLGSITYNSDGLITSKVTLTGIKKNFTYDKYQRLESEEMINPDGSTFKRQYTYENGNIASVVYSNEKGIIAHEKYSYYYNNLKDISLNDSIPILQNYRENEQGRKELTIFGGGIQQLLAYTDDGFPTMQNVLSPKFIMRKLYSFDKATGNLMSRTDDYRHLTETFEYDELNRLVKAGDEDYIYDPNGNITYRSSAFALKYNHNSNRYVPTMMAVYDGAMPLRNQFIIYNSLKRVASIKEDVYSASFLYDMDGNRVRIRLQENGKGKLTRNYFATQYETDSTTNGVKQRLYIGGDAYTAPAVYINEDGKWNIYYIIRDYQGSVTAIVDRSTKLVQELSYDAWGRLRDPQTWKAYAPDKEPSLFLGRGYCGHEHLQEFGFINMNARLYSPIMCRFLGPDPYIQDPMQSQGYNSYAYCLNNPLKHIDRSGKFFLPALLIGVAVGALIGAGTSAIAYSVTAWITGQKWSAKEFWKAVGMGSVGGAIGGGLGYLGSTWTALGSMGNKIGYNMLSQISNTMVTNKIFGNSFDVKGIFGMLTGSLVGAFMPSFRGGIKGQLFKNLLKDTGYNTLKGVATGSISGITNAFVYDDADMVWQGMAGGAISGAARSIVSDLVLGSPYKATTIHYSNKNSIDGRVVPALYREKGLFTSLINIKDHFHGVTIGRNAVTFVDDKWVAGHEAMHVLQQEQQGWANFYGRYAWEVFDFYVLGNDKNYDWGNKERSIYDYPGTLDNDAEIGSPLMNIF